MANTGNLVSVKMIADRLFRNPVMKDLSWEFIVDNAIEVLRILEAPSLYVNVKEQINIENFRGLKPAGMMKINNISKIVSGQIVPMITNEDNMSENYSQFSSLPSSPVSAYSVNTKYVNVNFESGMVLVDYKMLAMDEDCYPMILDNAVLLRCIESYIKYKWFDILNDMDVISNQKLNKAETDYLFNVAQADANLKLPSEDEMEALVNQITTLIPNRNQHAERFEFLGAKENLRIH
jgi:hypothetical protein